MKVCERVESSWLMGLALVGGLGVFEGETTLISSG